MTVTHFIQGNSYTRTAPPKETTSCIICHHQSATRTTGSLNHIAQSYCNNSENGTHAPSSDLRNRQVFEPAWLVGQLSTCREQSLMSATSHSQERCICYESQKLVLHSHKHWFASRPHPTRQESRTTRFNKLLHEMLLREYRLKKLGKKKNKTARTGISFAEALVLWNWK